MRLSRSSRWLPAIAGTIAACAAFSPVAQADFDDAFQSECAGSNIDGVGATFQNGAQTGFIAGFKAARCATLEFPSSTPTDIRYNPPGAATGSGAGRAAFGEGGTRSAQFRYAGTDEAPTGTQETAIEAGAAGDADNAVLRTIPVTQGAVTVSVNFPDGCTIPAGLRFRANADGTTRFAVQAFLIESVFFGETLTWGDFVDGIGGAGCADKPIRRVVRSDSSGTTFAFKQYLDALEPDRDPDWSNLLVGSGPNTTWPNPDVNGGLVRGNGNGGVATGIRTTDGSVGYVDLATARANGFDKTGSVPGGTATSAAADDTYWIPVRNANGTAVDPQEAANGYRDTTRPRGANCRRTNYRNVPGGADPTTQNFFNVTGVNDDDGYPICSLTYDLVWDDYCDAYGDTDAEQAKARTVFDFINYAVSTEGAANAVSRDYARLPDNIASLAVTGASRIGWQKPGGSCN